MFSFKVVSVKDYKIIASKKGLSKALCSDNDFIITLIAWERTGIY